MKSIGQVLSRNPAMTRALAGLVSLSSGVALVCGPGWALIAAGSLVLADSLADAVIGGVTAVAAARSVKR